MSSTTPNLGLFKYDTTTDGDLAFNITKALNNNWDIIDAVSSRNSRNIGEIVASTIPLTDAGLHLLDGALINGSGIYSEFVTYIAGLVSTYPSLFVTETSWQSTVTTYGVCGKFVYDATNNTVRLPKITGIIEGTVDVSALGDLVEAGLPNITGNFASYNRLAEEATASGAFEVTNNSQKNASTSSGSGHVTTYNFNASNSNHIYGNSSTVQPQTIKAFYYIVIATSTKTDIQVDIDEVTTDLNGKADRNLSNTTPTTSFATAMNTAGIRTVVETYQNGVSWYRVYSDGWCEQGGVITLNNSNATIQLLKHFNNKTYTVLTNPNSNTNNWPISYVQSSKTTSSFTIDGTGSYGQAARTIKISWIAIGYLAL